MNVASVAVRPPVRPQLLPATVAAAPRARAAAVDEFEPNDPIEQQAEPPATSQRASGLAQRILERGRRLLQLGASALAKIRRFLPFAERLAGWVKPFLPAAVGTAIDFVLKGLRAISDRVLPQEANA